MQINHKQFEMLNLAKQKQRGDIKPIYSNIRVINTPDGYRRVFGFNLLGFLIEANLDEVGGVFIPLGYANLLRAKFSIDNYINAHTNNSVSEIHISPRQRIKTIEGRVHYPHFIDNLRYDDKRMPIGDYFIDFSDTKQFYWECKSERGVIGSFISNTVFCIK